MSQTQQNQPAPTSPNVGHIGHGNSIAAWTAVIIMILSSVIMAIAVIVTSLWLFIVGVLVAIAGIAAGKVMSAMGFGVSGRPGH